MQRAVDKALETYDRAPTAFPSLAGLDPAAFERWALRTPERWVRPEDLPRDAEGRVCVGGDAVMVWRYVTAVLARLRAEAAGAHKSEDDDGAPAA